MLKVELMAEDVERKRKERYLFSAVAFLILVIALVGGAYGGMFLYQGQLESKLQTLQEEKTGIDNQIIQLEDALEEALLAQKQLDNLERLLNRRMFWTNFFSELGRITIPDVFYSSFKGDIETRSVELPAYARNYHALARQLKAWEQEDIVESVDVSNARLGAYGERAAIMFSAELVFKEDAWHEK